MAERTAISVDDEKRRTIRNDARLLVKKLWLDSSSKKWSFEWNGIPISAPIKDEIFLAKLESREILIGSGDALETVIEYEQDYDDSVEMWVNDPHSYRVISVRDHRPYIDRQREIDE